MVRKPWFVEDTGFSWRMSDEDRGTFMRICPDKHYPKGSAVFRMGDPATDLHVIAAGQVKLVSTSPSGNERILAVCGPDDFIGEAFLHEAEFYRADAVALTDAVTCPVSREQFLRLARKAPTVALLFSKILASQLAHCRAQLGGSFDPVKKRVVRALLEQARRFGTPLEGGWCELHTELRHEEMAALVSATRVSVTTALAELREEGLVLGSRGAYRLNLPGLTSLLEL